MSLAEFQVERADIMSKDKVAFTVRGLNLDDITFLAENYLSDILKAVALYGKTKRNLMERKNLGEFLLVLTKDFPTLAAEMISRASDEEGQLDKVRSLPFMLQLNALKEILRLSAEEAGGLKNLLAVLAAALEIDQKSIPGLGDLVTHLQSITGPSGTTSASSLQTDTDTPTDIRSPE